MQQLHQKRIELRDHQKGRNLKPIYFDHCSTTPMDPRVLDAMLPYMRELYGNPSTPHQSVGRVANKAVSDAREATAELINCRLNEIIYTSGATESNNLAILGRAGVTGSEKRHIVTQVTEHSSVLGPCQHLEENGWRVFEFADQFFEIEPLVTKLDLFLRQQTLDDLANQARLSCNRCHSQWMPRGNDNCCNVSVNRDGSDFKKRSQ